MHPHCRCLCHWIFGGILTTCAVGLCVLSPWLLNVLGKCGPDFSMILGLPFTYATQSNQADPLAEKPNTGYREKK